MAQYKVPQDVEADDKLIGPFSFRQFVYLVIAVGLGGAAYGLFQIFPLLAIIPTPGILFFLVLALPLKKDQPMETYLAAVISFYLKPNKRFWTPGQRESSIQITVPKKAEKSRARDISGDEASSRLSFLADLVDSEGKSIKNSGSMLKEDVLAEANNTLDMFEVSNVNLDTVIDRQAENNHQKALDQMKAAINNVESIAPNSSIEAHGEIINPEPTKQPALSPEQPENNFENANAISPKPAIIELVNNPDYSVQTVEKEINRMKEKKGADGEIYVSLH